MSDVLSELTSTIVQQWEREIVRCVTISLLPLLPYTFRGRRLSRNYFLREMLNVPMNYWRCLEVPLTAWALQAKPGERVVDLSSPKLLALYLSLQGYSVMATDISDYFVNDLRQLKHELAISPLEIAVAAGQHLPLQSGSIDKIYSISVLEHIPNHGDAEVIAEVSRVLKPGGTCCLTVPFYTEYVEEFGPGVYWSKFSVQDKRGVFFQRRYDLPSLKDRLLNDPYLQSELLMYMAEKPLVEPRLREDYVFDENCHWLNRRFLSILSAAFRAVPVLRVPIPMLGYLVQSNYSHRYHYLTEDPEDKNVRGVFVRLRKR